MRLIDADALINTLNKEKIKFNADINYIILNAPTIDAVQVVRCKDCRYFKKYGFKLEYTECLHFDCDVSKDGYCAWGAKMEDEDEIN